MQPQTHEATLLQLPVLSSSCSLTLATGTRQATLQRLQHAMANCRRQLPDELVPQVHVMGYGRSVDARFLQQLASAGNGSYLVCGSAADVAADVARLQLVGAFEQLAERPDKRGALMVGP
jgi:hypothetical protein